MFYNTVLVHLDIDHPSVARIRIASQLAEDFEADLIGFCACDTYMPPSVAVEGGFEAQFFAQQRDDIQRHLEEARARFDEVTGDSERASWRGLVGDPTRLLADHARAADLIVTGVGESGVLSDGYRSVDIGSLVLSAGRPVLLLAPGKSTFEAERVLVGWKNTREARRAVSDALPVLRRASDVLVTAVEEGNREEMTDSVADVVRFLMKHGVKARSEVLSSSKHVGEVLIETAHAMQAGLIVSGGFGHSRVREWAFGGATRTMISDESIHRLLSN